MSNTSLYRGNLTAIVLQLLDTEGRMYGYEITQKVKEKTNGSLEIKEGALYPILHKLEAQNFLTVEAEKVDNRIRKYYKITEAGEQERVSQLEALREYMTTMEQLFNPKWSY
ncbi:DNA-binding transcriptional regulator, PadR family [Nonlabens sp. Hel1_33_55]|uniref:PadR family transcriptional regulator n=1 Tax=Nonlabens sp. Hel1_33_55 TaxID=1336802 RepID=UPI000875D9BB|nr:PadR family transcriptional regulator [Nonlabens sp. Hel1_33_55]SCY05937.1 DNA-binding transcriptional regulator, PadR family [Nonlabens sp. Hel1_33_55]